jgi:hypothetical protein
LLARVKLDEKFREVLLGGFVMSDAAPTRYAREVIVIVVPGALACVLRT